MSGTERTFSPAFKAGLVIELLEGKKDAAAIAEENAIPVELLLGWKETFLEKAPDVFGKKKDGSQAGKPARVRRENKASARKAEKLERELEWLEKTVAEELGPDWEKMFTPRPR